MTFPILDGAAGRLDHQLRRRSLLCNHLQILVLLIVWDGRGCDVIATWQSVRQHRLRNLPVSVLSEYAKGMGLDALAFAKDHGRLSLSRGAMTGFGHLPLRVGMETVIFLGPSRATRVVSPTTTTTTKIWQLILPSLSVSWSSLNATIPTAQNAQ